MRFFFFFRPVFIPLHQVGQQQQPLPRVSWADIRVDGRGWAIAAIYDRLMRSFAFQKRQQLRELGDQHTHDRQT